LLHVGYHKTGTTWLQQRLFVRAHGFQQIASHQEISDLFERPTDLTWDVERACAFCVERLSATPPGLVPVLSSEILCGHPFLGGRDGAVMARRLARVLPEARILVTIRAQARILPSTYMQYLARGGTMPPGAFFAGTRRPGYFGFDPAHFEYHRLAELLSDLWDGRLHVMPQEALERDADAAAAGLAAFAQARGFGGLAPEDRAPRAASAPEHAIPVLRRLNHVQRSTLNPSPIVALGTSPDALLSRGTRWIARRAAVARLAGAWRPATEAARRFDGRWADSNAALARLVPGLDLTGYESPEASNTPVR
jgi:hypothetical protein